MKKILLPALVLILAGFSAYLFLTKNNATFNKELRNFAVKDTANITKIFIADKDGNQVTMLRKSPTNWLLNNTYPADVHALKYLLEAMVRMEVRASVPKAAEPKVLADMASSIQRKVEIYVKDELVKTFFVGTDTPNNDGTYMMLEGSAVPFVVYMPGFNGFLSPRFSPYAFDWKLKEITNMDRSEIASISFINHKVMDESFEIYQPSPDSCLLYSMYPTKQLMPGNKLPILAYLSTWKGLQYEADTKIERLVKDSVQVEKPIFTLSITDKKGKITKLSTYPMRNQLQNMPGETPMQADRFYGILNDKDAIIIQYITFQPCLRILSELKK